MFSNKLKGIFVDSVSEAKKREFKYISKTGYHQANRKKRLEIEIHSKLEIHFLVECRYKNNIKALSEKLKKVLPGLISSQRKACVKNRHIGESRRLISDII